MFQKRKKKYFSSALFLFALLTGCSSPIQKQVQITESVEGRYVSFKIAGSLALKKCMETTLTNNDLDQYFLSKGVKVISSTKFEKPIKYKQSGNFYSAVCIGKSYILEGSESLFKPLNDDIIYILNQVIIERELKEDLQKEEAREVEKEREIIEKERVLINNFLKNNSTDSINNFLKNNSTDSIIGKGETSEVGSTLTVHYRGYLQDGTEFDNSYKRGKPFTFRIGTGKVIKGWELGLLRMKVGGKRKLIIPSELGYGSRIVGPIPANSTLIFDVELLGIEK